MVKSNHCKNYQDLAKTNTAQLSCGFRPKQQLLTKMQTCSQYNPGGCCYKHISVPPSVVFSCGLFQCRIRSGHLTSVLCNCYTGARPRAAAWCQYHHYALQYAIYTHTTVQIRPRQLTDPSYFCYCPKNVTNERMITLCIVHHIVPSTLHIS